MIKTEQFQQGSVEIMHMDGIFLGLESKFIGAPIDTPGLAATASQPHGKPIMVVIPSVDFPLVGTRSRHFHRRSAPKFPTPDHKHVIQHASLFQILDQGRNGLVRFPRESAVVHLDVIVVVPRLTGPMPELDKTHSALHQTAGDEQLPALLGIAVKIPDGLGLAGHIEGIRRIHLHPVGQLEALYA